MTADADSPGPRVPSQSAKVDEICDLFEFRWQEGQRPLLEDHLEGVDLSIQPRLLRQLLFAEWDLRRQAQESFEVDQYISRFSEHTGMVRATYREWHGEVQSDDATDHTSDHERFLRRSDSGGTIAKGDSSTVHGRFLPGTRLADRYRIVSLVGKGGMGEVYRADDLRLGHTVALKFLPQSLAKDTGRLQLFDNEVRLSRQISHPNVCRVYDIADADGQPFISMEYVDGEDLKSLLRRIGRLPNDKGVDIARQLCAGLAAAHDRRVVHRDLKPANVMLDGRGRVRITDFGLSRLVSTSDKEREFGGTPAYMAPEQLLHGETSFRSDIYSLGLLLYEIFAGKPFHEGASVAELRRQHELRFAVPHLSQLTDEVDPVVKQTMLECLERRPEDRPPSIAAVASVLPGGDPLAATLAAGDTPSPQMVAAARATGSMSTKAAVASFLVVATGLLIVAMFADRYTLMGQVNPKSPEFLVNNKVHHLLQHFGCVDHTAMTEQFKTDRIAYGFGHDQPAIEYALNKDKSPRRWDGLPAGDPPLIYFWYRQCSKTLTPDLFRGDTGALGFRREMVSEFNPSPYGNGMVSFRLDATGKLLHFHSHPQALLSKPDATNQGWDEQHIALTFRLAGLDYADFEPDDQPEWTSSAPADTFHRWTDSAAHIVEAATFRGQIILFNVIRPWDVTTSVESPDETSTYGQGITFVVIFCVVLTAATYVCYRNLRMDRGDRRTATMLAALVFVASALEWICVASHTSSVTEFDVFIVCLSTWLFHSFSAWIFYLAAEPYVRRYWPESLTSWCRFFEGRFTDPLVGRDVLLGASGGVISAVVVAICILAPSRLGFEAPLPFRNWDDETLTYILAPRYALGGVVAMLRQAILHAVFSLLLLFMLRLLVRRRWLAAAIFICIAAAMRWEQVPPWYLVIISLWSCIGVFLLTRYGMIACASWLYVFFLLTIPITVSGWYLTYGTFIIAVVLGFAAYGLYTVLGGRPLISDARLSGD